MCFLVFMMKSSEDVRFACSRASVNSAWKNVLCSPGIAYWPAMPWLQLVHNISPVHLAGTWFRPMSALGTIQASEKA